MSPYFIEVNFVVSLDPVDCYWNDPADDKRHNNEVSETAEIHILDILEHRTRKVELRRQQLNCFDSSDA